MLKFAAMIDICINVNLSSHLRTPCLLCVFIYVHILELLQVSLACHFKAKPAFTFGCRLINQLETISIAELLQNRQHACKTPNAVNTRREGE